MTIEIFLAVIAWLAFSISGIFQIIRMYQTKSSHDISLVFIILLLVGVLATTGLTYMGTNSIAYILERTINSLLSMLIAIMVIYYRRRTKKSDESTRTR